MTKEAQYIFFFMFLLNKLTSSA